MFKRSLSSLDLAPPLGTPQPGSSPPPSAGGNAYPFPAQTANHSQLDKAALTRSTTSFSSLLIALSELAEIEGRKAKSEKKLAKCLKEVATSWDSSNFRVPATLLVASELVKGLATVDAVHAVSIQGKYEALNSSVADYFKRVAREEKTQDQRLESLDGKVKKASAEYEKSRNNASKRPSLQEAASAAASHDKYITSLSQLSNTIASAKVSHGESMYDKREVIGQEVAREMSTILEGMWKNRVEGVRKGGEKIAEVMERAMWCENNMPVRIDEQPQGKDSPIESTSDVPERVTILHQPPSSTLKGPRPAPSVPTTQSAHQTEVVSVNGDQSSSSDRQSSRSYSPEQPRHAPHSSNHTPSHSHSPSPRSAPLELDPVPQARPQTLDLPTPNRQLRKKSSAESNATSTRRRSGEMERGAGGFSSDSLDDLIPSSRNRSSLTSPIDTTSDHNSYSSRASHLNDRNSDEVQRAVVPLDDLIPSSRIRSSLTSPIDTTSDRNSYSSNRNSIEVQRGNGVEVQRAVVPPRGYIMDDDPDSPSTGRIRWEDEQQGRRSQERRRESVELSNSIYRANTNFSAQVLPTSNDSRTGRFESSREYGRSEGVSTTGPREEGREKDNSRMERTLSTDSERNFVMRMREKYAIERGDREVEAREEKRSIPLPTIPRSNSRVAGLAQRYSSNQESTISSTNNYDRPNPPRHRYSNSIQGVTEREQWNRPTRDQGGEFGERYESTKPSHSSYNPQQSRKLDFNDDDTDGRRHSYESRPTQGSERYGKEEMIHSSVCGCGDCSAKNYGAGSIKSPPPGVEKPKPSRRESFFGMR